MNSQEMRSQENRNLDVKSLSSHLRPRHLLVLLIALSVLGAYWWVHEYQQEKKLDEERKVAAEQMRASGKLQAEMMRNSPIRLPMDPLAPPGTENMAPSDQEELAQIQLWQKTPPAAREKIRPEVPSSKP